MERQSWKRREGRALERKLGEQLQRGWCQMNDQREKTWEKYNRTWRKNCFPHLLLIPELSEKR